MTAATTKICRVKGCGRAVDAYGLCRPHREREKEYGHPEAGPPLPPRKGTRKPCKAPGCRNDRTPQKDFCNAHLLRLKRYGDLLLGDPLKAPRGRIAIVDSGISANHPLLPKNPTSSPTSPWAKSGTLLYFVDTGLLAKHLLQNKNPTDSLTPVPPHSGIPVHYVDDDLLVSQPTPIKKRRVVYVDDTVLSCLPAWTRCKRPMPPEDAAAFAKLLQDMLSADEIVILTTELLKALLVKASGAVEDPYQEVDADSTEREPE